MKRRDVMSELDKAHAELHYGKYSAGYNRGWARGREERWALIQERDRYRRFLRELEARGRDMFPAEFQHRLFALLSGTEG